MDEALAPAKPLLPGGGLAVSPGLLRWVRARLRRQRDPVTRASERRLKELVASGIVRLGPHTYGLPDVRRYPGDTAHVHIGSFVSIAERVIIFVGGNHPVDWVSTFPFRVHFQLPGALSDGCPTSKGDVVIGHDVWIGAGATILSGVHIGNGAVVGANSVVTKAVRPYAIAVGNPAREVRRRFSDEEIAALERVAWWDWPTERVVANVHLLSSRDVGAFLEAVTGEGVGRPTTEGLL